MAPKRSRDSKPLDEEEMLMCAAALLELSASFPKNKQLKIVPPVKRDPRKGTEVTGREVARKPEKQTGKNTKVEWELGLPTLSPVGLLRNQSKVGNFLEACSLCKKKLHDKDVFMYGNYGAFCSTPCRNIKIISDGYHVEFFCQSKNSSTAKNK